MGNPVQHLSTRDLAQRWGTSTGHLANLRSERRGPAFLKIGTSVMYEVALVEEFEAAHRVATKHKGA